MNRIKEEFVQTIRILCKEMSLYIQRIKSFLSKLKVAARKYIEIQVDIKRAKHIRQSWVMKQDTRKGSQVLCNKPRVYMPKILY